VRDRGERRKPEALDYMSIFNRQVVSGGFAGRAIEFL